MRWQSKETIERVRYTCLNLQRELVAGLVSQKAGEIARETVRNYREVDGWCESRRRQREL